MSMNMSMTARVMEHMEAVPKGEKIGAIYIRDHAGQLTLFKSGQRIIKKEFGHMYWRAGSVDVLVHKLSKDKYEVSL